MGPKQVLPLQVRVATFPKGPELEPHHQMVQGHIQDIHLERSYPLQRCSQHILQPNPTKLIKPWNIFTYVSEAVHNMLQDSHVIMQQ